MQFSSLRGSASIAILAASIAASLSAANAAVVISSGATANMICSGGVCAPTAASAALNVGDLETLLASGNVTVTTTGTGVEAKDIDIKTALNWSTTGALSLDANRSIAIDQAVSITGLSGLSLAAGSSGALSFGKKGHVAFANLSSALTISGASYSLVGTIASLASAVKSNPSANYALAGNYDASGDGTYGVSPIGTDLQGVFNGLGNSISNLSIDDSGRARTVLGFFAGNNGTIEFLRLTGLVISTKKERDYDAGGLVALNTGLLLGDYVSGSFQGLRKGYAGGLAGVNHGTIAQSQTVVQVAGFSRTGGIAVKNLSLGYAGGLIGINADNNSNAPVLSSYSTGAVTGGTAGGVVGDDIDPNTNFTDTYWDTETSGQSQGAGNLSNAPGITGLTTAQFQSGLPSGFDPKIWAENADINGGLPYLIANPPPKK
jgi:hypothetical protein